MGVTITTRVLEDIEKEIRSISEREQLDKSTVVGRLLSSNVATTHFADKKDFHFSPEIPNLKY